MWAHSPGVLPPPNSHWTGYIHADCSPSLILRWSYLEKRERWGWKHFPNFWEALWQISEEEHCLSGLISLSVPLSSPHPHQVEGTQTGGGSGFHPVLKLLQDINQARAQLECELVQETQELAKRYDDRQIKQARRHKRGWAQMVKQTDTTFQVVFFQASLANSIKLLPWCISSTVPLCYMSRALATTMQQDEYVPGITTASKPDGSPAPGPSSSPDCPPRTMLLQNTSFTRYPICRHSTGVVLT